MQLSEALAISLLLPPESLDLPLKYSTMRFVRLGLTYSLVVVLELILRIFRHFGVGSKVLLQIWEAGADLLNPRLALIHR